MFLSRNQDMRNFVMNLLEELLNPRRNTTDIPFYKLYNRDRSILLSDNNQIKENFIWHYNNKSKNWKNGNSNSYAAIAANANGNNHNNINNNYNNNGNRDKRKICPYFNGEKGCEFGRRCKLNNICYHCKSERHGVLACFTAARRIMENGTLLKYYNTRPMGQRHNPRELVVIGIDGTVYYLDPQRYQHFGSGSGNNNNNNDGNSGKGGKRR